MSIRQMSLRAALAGSVLRPAAAATPVATAALHCCYKRFSDYRQALIINYY